MERYYTDGTEPDVLPHFECHGPCNQGRLPCPTPQACQRPEPSEPFTAADLFVAVICIIVAAFMVGLAYGALRA